MQKFNDNIIKNFLDNLKLEGKSNISIKNYKSDIGHFLAWAILKLKSFGTYVENTAEMTPFFSNEFFQEYRTYMKENNIKIKTINRRLSTLRNFSKFLAASNIIDTDFMQGIQNVGIGNAEKVQGLNEEILEKFRESLIKSGGSESTVKNYLSDVKSFLTWIEQKGDLPNAI